MIWGGGSGKSGKKNSTATHQGKKKLNSTTRKVQRLVAEEKKTQREFFARGPPQIINGPSLTHSATCTHTHFVLCHKSLYVIEIQTDVSKTEIECLFVKQI